MIAQNAMRATRPSATVSGAIWWPAHGSRAVSTSRLNAMENGSLNRCGMPMVSDLFVFPFAQTRFAHEISKRQASRGRMRSRGVPRDRWRTAAQEGQGDAVRCRDARDTARRPRRCYARTDRIDSTRPCARCGSSRCRWRLWNLVMNLTTAKTLDLTIPPPLLRCAKAVIE